MATKTTAKTTVQTAPTIAYDPATRAQALRELERAEIDIIAATRALGRAQKLLTEPLREAAVLALAQTEYARDRVARIAKHLHC